MKQTNILVTGANGQIGSVLTTALRKKYGTDHVLATDIRPNQQEGRFEILDVLDSHRLAEIAEKNKITEIYHLAAILSAKGELAPVHTWDVNIKSMLNVFEVAREKKIKKVFSPSSIAAFGNNINPTNVAQNRPMQPTTVYGISKVAGELWNQYYFDKYGLDIRSVRYPGVIGYQNDPGGGTTDYAVEIFHAAVKNEPFTCFLKPDTRLPMIYMEDTIRATLDLMNAPSENIKVRTSYNLSGLNFSPSEIYERIKKEVPNFKINYAPDDRQKIADSWPNSIDDTAAQNDWNWAAAFDLEKMTADMLKNLRIKYTK